MPEKKEKEKEKETPKVPTTKAEKLKAVQAVGKELDKQFDSPGTFQRQGLKVGVPRPSLPSSLPSLDWKVFGCGGFPKGRIIEMYGLESCGKTALACHLIGQVQKAGGVAAFVDAEHALDPTFATVLGVDMSELVISQPDCGENALETVEALVDASAVDLIVVDSVAALVPRAELAGEMGDSHMGLQARMMSQAMRKLAGKVSKKNVTVIFINQIRQKVGLVFGDPNVTTGGFGLKFAASVRLEIRKVAASKDGVIKEGDTIVGHKINIKAQKNKVGAPFRETQITLFYDTGFDTMSDILDHAVAIGVLSGGGAKYAFPGGEKISREEVEKQISHVRDLINKHYAQLGEELSASLGGENEEA
jgi:recombination protein RecA